MTDSINPYSPPPTEVPDQSWWSRIASVLFGGMRFRPERVPPDFAKGEAIIVSGIAFFIDPSDKQTLYAGSPSSDQSDQRFALVVREAIRYLPEFLAENRHSLPRVDDRRLVVRIVHDYRGIFSDYSRAVEVLPAPLSIKLLKPECQIGG